MRHQLAWLRLLWRLCQQRPGFPDGAPDPGSADLAVGAPQSDGNRQVGAPAIEGAPGCVSMRGGAGRGPGFLVAGAWPRTHTGGGPEAAVSLGGERPRGPLSPAALPRGASGHGRQQMQGEAGEGQAPPRTPAAIWAAGGGRAEPLRRASGRAAARLGRQPAWGLGQQSCPGPTA